MEDIILNTLDDIASTRSSLARRELALSSLERLLASICVSSSDTSQLHIFLDLQSRFETNIASRLVSSLASWTPALHNALSTASDDVPLDAESVHALCRPMMHAMAILQGVSLLHSPSKCFLARRWCIQLFLDLLLLSRHVSSAVTEAFTPTKSSLPTSTASKAASSSPSPTLSSTIIDTLLCVLVDSPEGLRSFEEVGGLDAVVRTLKRAGVPKETKIKCLEFLYFYLLPEEELMISGAKSDRMLCPQKSTSTDDLQTSPYTAFNTLSGATMIDHGNSPLPPPPVSMITITPASSSESMTTLTSSDGKPFAPNPKIHELRLLTKELDFTPSSPVKKRQQVAALGVGMPCTPNRKTDGTISDHNTPSKFNSDLAAWKSGALSDVEPKTPSRRQERHAAKGSAQNNKDLAPDPSSSSLMDFGVFVKSNTKHQGRNAIFPSESGSSASDGSTRTIDCTWDQPRRAKDVVTPSKRGGRYLHAGSAAAGGTQMRKSKSEVHSSSRHAHSKSEANMLSNGAKSMLMVRSQSVDKIGLMTPAPTNTSSPRGRRVKSTQEKKELLGTCLGNVDALVEGMKKAGAWGLV